MDNNFIVTRSLALDIMMMEPNHKGHEVRKYLISAQKLNYLMKEFMAENRVLYMEATCTSDAGAHALMGSVSDPRGAAEFRFCRVGEADDYIEIQPPESPRLANVRLAVPGWSRHVHHIAMLDRSGDLMLAPDDQTLWRKLRGKRTCPTLAEWRQALIAVIHRSGMLLACEAFGVPEGVKAFVLAANAQETFDSIISVHTRSNSLLHRVAA